MEPRPLEMKRYRGVRQGNEVAVCHLLMGPQRQRQGHAVPQAAPLGNWLLWAPQAGVGTKLHKRAGMVSAKVTALLPGKIGDAGEERTPDKQCGVHWGQQGMVCLKLPSHWAPGSPGLGGHDTHGGWCSGPQAPHHPQPSPWREPSLTGHQESRRRCGPRPQTCCGDSRSCNRTRWFC